MGNPYHDEFFAHELSFEGVEPVLDGVKLKGIQRYSLNCDVNQDSTAVLKLELIVDMRGIPKNERIRFKDSVGKPSFTSDETKKQPLVDEKAVNDRIRYFLNNYLDGVAATLHDTL